MTRLRRVVSVALTICAAAVLLSQRLASVAQAPAPPAPAASVVISEVLFDPKPGEAPFVELLNAGAEPVDLSQMALSLGESSLQLVRCTDPLPANALLLIRFDGQGRVEGRTLHAPSGVTLGRSGAVELRDEHDDPIDRIAWGGEDGAADEDVFDGTPPAGRTLGRPPGANTPQSRNDWVVYTPEAATPGQENPLPQVDVLLPLDGAVISGPAQLHWYSVIGGARYRVQIARDESFSSPVFDQVVASARANPGLLAAGQYVWRVQAIDSRGGASSFSAPSGLEVVSSPVVRAFRLAPDDRPAQDAILVPVAFTLIRQSASAQSSQALPDVLLPVPLIIQHKDTAMLLLENPHRDDPHGWERDHRTYDEDDPSDDSNCVLASIAMANHYLGGDLSEDRIGYEIKSRNAEKYTAAIVGAPGMAGLDGRNSAAGITEALREKQQGPEGDLNYGRGANVPQTVAALTFAFNPTGSIVPHLARTWRYADDEVESLWKDIKNELDHNRPLIGARRNAPGSNSGHAFAVRGYGQETDGRRFLVINDPITGYEQVHIDRMRHSVLSQFRWYFLPETPVARRQELTVTLDSDGDGVVDFDETERFFTDPHNPDSDGDGVPDKKDIASGVFDSVYGYAQHTASSRGRDFDADGVPTERDPDSDNGGCKDGVEDRNADGERTGDERWNFNTADDLCGDVNGKIEVHTALIQNNGLHQRARHDFLVTVKLQAMQPGVVGSIVDRGSSYTMHSVGSQRIDNGDCSISARTVAQGAGTFDREGTSIGGMVYHDDDPSVDPDDPARYHPPGYRIIIDARGTGDGTATVDSCLISGTSKFQGGVSTPECVGYPTDSSAQTFEFDCTKPPATPPDTQITLWSVKGRVTISPVRSARLPLSQLFRRAQ